MTDLRNKTPGEILTDASVAEFIKALGLSIAEAQKALDMNSISQVGEYLTPRPGLGGKSLLQLGLSPPFYHYQYADLNVSMQLTMKVGETEAFGIGANVQFGLNQGTGGSGQGQARTAQITLSSLPASVSVNDARLTATGTTLDALADSLVDQLRKPTGRFDRVFIGGTRRTVPARLDPASPAPTNPILTAEGAAIAFLPTAATSLGLIRIVNNPSQAEEFRLAPDTNNSVTVNPAADADAYATAVTNAINGTPNFRARLVRNAGATTSGAPPAPGVIGIALFDTNDDRLKPAAISELQLVANLLRGRSEPVTINGYADTRSTVSYNTQLAEKRATNVRDFLERAGIPRARLTVATPAPGETRWGATSGNPDNPQFRRVEVVLAGAVDRFIVVENTGATQLQATPTPDKTAAGATGNGFVSVNVITANAIEASTRVMLGTAETPAALSGASVDTGGVTLAQNTPEAYAHNLAATINGLTAATPAVRATRRGAVVYLARADDAITLDLLTTETGDLRLTADGGASISQPLTSVTSGSGSGPSQPTSPSNDRVSLAVGIAVDYRTSRMYETSINGNSSISARLVAVPAPVEFLDEIREYLPKPGSLSPPAGPTP